MNQEIMFKIDPLPRIRALPEGPHESLNIRYPLIPPYAYAHIYWDKANKELVYEVEEPVLSEDEQYVLNVLEDGIKELINISFIAVNEDEQVITYLEKNVQALLEELRIQLTEESYLHIMYYIYRDFVGLGRIEPFLNDYFIEDIECNGSNLPVYLVHRKYRNVRTNVVFKDNDELRNFVERLAQKCGKYISYATPLLDGRLPDGSRINATYTQDISSLGPTFSIRKFTKSPWTPIHLIHLKTVSPQLMAYLWTLIEYEKNIMIIGGTASGKTTLLNGLAFFIPPQARVISIEDTRELALFHSNWLPSVAREGVGLANIAGQKHGEVTLFDLLKESFRQNPDYVIVGEIRGPEAYVLFQGMASGHPSFGTMHANSVDSMIRRLSTPPINLSASLVESLDAVCVMVSTKVKGKPSRRLREVVEIKNVNEKTKKSSVNEFFTWEPNTDSFTLNGKSHVLEKIQKEFGVPIQKLEREIEIRTKLLIRMYQMGVFAPGQVASIIREYYKDPGEIIKRFRL
tara:strand:- start:17445 stop:18992 length:1548 start_codon:yes stop_codon:yes gene_type:complete